MTIHRPDLLREPGYWFVAPYRSRSDAEPRESWIGPCVYDGSNGELVWSGGLQYNENVEDFRLNNYAGRRVMTLMTGHHAYILDRQYDVLATIDNAPGAVLNTHELNFNDDGTRALMIHTEHKVVRVEDNGVARDCWLAFDGFVELDMTVRTPRPVFEWTSEASILADESTYLDDPLDKRCSWWDYMHANAVDRIPGGDFLLSARHTDTVYRISRRTGSIVWRLGGRKSSFRHAGGFAFSRQHDIRFRGKNDSHIFVSILDNAKGQDQATPTWSHSRGLVIAIDEVAMTATVLTSYEHPKSEYAPRRGNVQQLPNGNVFIGWSEKAAQSEFRNDGTLIWDAELMMPELGSYRNYKFGDFSGMPSDSPTVAGRMEMVDQRCKTSAYVSWNGATAVTAWRLCESDGKAFRLHRMTTPKTGFETELIHWGYMRYITVEALDDNGRIIGQTPIVSPMAVGDIPADIVRVGEERLMHPHRERSVPLASAILLLCGSLVACLCLVSCRRRPGRSDRGHYTAIAQEEIPMRQIPQHVEGFQ